MTMNKIKFFLSLLTVALKLTCASPVSAQQFNTTDGTTYQADDSAFKGIWDETSDLYKLQAATVGAAGNTITWSDALTIDADGNIGIDTTDPDTPLDVSGEIKIGTTTGLARDADRQGAIRYSTSENCIELCDGTSWACAGSAL